MTSVTNQAKALLDSRGSEYGCFPLGLAQERIWLREQLAPGGPLFHIAGAVRLRGDVDPVALRASLQELVRRHEALRTSFLTVGDGVYQRIHPDAELSFEVGTIPGNGEPVSERDLAGVMRQEATRPFDLGAPLVPRARLIRRPGGEQVLILVLHHLVADGWSIGVLLRELQVLYRDHRAGRPPSLAEPEIQYADYAAWQRERLTGGALDASLSYWRGQLGGATPGLPLPACRPSRAEQGYPGKLWPLSLGQALTQAVREFSRREGVTVFTTLLTALQLLLSRLTRQKDILVGSPVSGRRERQTHGVVGLFVNMVGLRTLVDGRASFRELLRGVRATVLDAQAHEDVPFEAAAPELARSRSSDSPLTCVLAWQAGLNSELMLGDVRGRGEPIHTGTAKFDLTLNLDDLGPEIAGPVEYRSDRYSAETIDRFCGQFVQLLGSAVADPDLGVARLGLLDAGERKRVLGRSRGPALGDRADDTVLELFGRRLADAPQAIALQRRDECLTYLDLDRRSERLAARLRRLGARQESLIGVFCEPGPDAVVAMLAILKCGSAYLPLDPAYPDERLHFMIRDAGCLAIFTEPRLRRRFSSGEGPALVVTDDELNSPPLQAAEVEGSPPGLENLAYVIYTSGSSGQPKGVEVTHRGLANLVRWHRQAFSLGPGDRTGQVASQSFDASVWEIWSALTSGAALFFPSAEVRLLPAGLRDWILSRGITSCFLPTPLAEAVLALDWPAHAPLRLLLTGGDRLRSRPRAGLPFQLVNNYGPTEASVVATSQPVSPEPSASAPSIGRPIASAAVYLLDDQLELVPTGVPGELHVAGVGVARGYRGRPALTAERFLPDPFSRAPGARLYRTGDLGSHTEDGDLMFLGRTDQQIKLRGHRIEPDEVAASLKREPSVADAFVDLRRSPDGAEPLLAAYVVFRPAQQADEARLRQHLRRHLPEYMIPSLLLPVAALPLTANGKIDRQALEQLSPPVQGQRRSPLSSPAEEVVAQVWSSLLVREDICPEASFFELGGHSLSAAQMIVRLREAFGKEVPLRWAFDYPVLRDLVAQVGRLGQTGASPPSARLDATLRTSRLPLSSGQERLWFLDRFTGSRAAYHIAGAVRLRGPLDRDALARSLEGIVARHEVLRTSVREEGGVPYQQLEEGVRATLSFSDLRQSGVEPGSSELSALLRAEVNRCFDLGVPPLLRCRLYQIGDDEHVFLLVLHHIVADGWSIGILLAELVERYRAHRQGQAPGLAPLEVQYPDYVAWQRQQLTSGAFAGSLAYWLDQLRGAPAGLTLPQARTREGNGSIASYEGGTAKIELPAGLVREIEALGRREGATLFMTLLAAWEALLARTSGTYDIVVGTDFASRNHPALEPLIGLMVNQVVLRTDLGGAPSFRELLGRVKRVVLQAWEHQDVPFGAVVEHLRPPRELGRNPLFQVMVILQSAPATLNLPGLDLSPVEMDAEGAVFDLSLAFVPRAGGLVASLRYASIFERRFAEQLLTDLRSVLEAVVTDPDACPTTSEVNRSMREDDNRVPPGQPAGSRVSALLEGLRATRPRPTTIVPSELVAMRRLEAEHPLPLLVEARRPDVDLAAWLADQVDDIRQRLAREGALLFRGFAIGGAEDFRKAVQRISPALIPYGERSSPRSEISAGIYTSTDHPEDEPILLHNEQSYTLEWPRRIWFCCLQPALRGGATPIADSRRILKRLTPATIARFRERQVLYVRNYGENFGLSWVEAFQTTDREKVAEHCRRAHIQLQWSADGRLHTRQVRPALRTHPETGEATWFNHLLFFHVSSLPERVLSAMASGLTEHDLPFNTFYGDGGQIEPEVLAEIRAAYLAETRGFPWQQGDILALDNMLVAHGRDPFVGPRRIAVAMTDPHDALAPREGAP